MKIFYKIFGTALTAIALFVPTNSASAEKTRNVLDLKHDITDSSIVYPESYELDTRKMLEGWYMKNYTATDDRYKQQGDVETSDAVIRDRLSKLHTVIDMPFNQIVRSYIDRYTTKNRAGIAAMLGLSLYYMPIFEQALEEQGLPLELKYLPVIESALNPNAVSHSGAGGLWQFMVATGKGMGLEVSSLVDERRDPYLSSKKAAQYLKSLYDTYGDWSLAIAAYNCGPGTVNKAIRRAGGDPKSHDFWSIYYNLPAETRGYVPMFIAANYVMNYYPYHNISPVLATKPLVTDTVMINKRVHFNQISKVLDIPIDEIRVLNPQFRADIIPGHPDHQYTLVLPSQQIHAYIMSEKDILNYEAARYAQRTEATPGDSNASDAQTETVNADELVAEETPLEQAPQNTNFVRQNKSGATKTISHKVEPGQTLSSIAGMYDVTVADIKTWNNLTRNNVRTGQLLRITTTPELANNSSAREVAPAQSQTVTSRQNNNESRNTQTADNARSRKNRTNNESQTASTQKKGSKAEKNDTSKSGSKAKAASNQASTGTHSVKSGENLTVIAKKYGTTVADLKKANNMTGDALQPGDKLKIPGTKGTSASSSKSKTSGKSTANSSKSTSKKSSGSSAKSSSKSKKKKK